MTEQNHHKIHVYQLQGLTLSRSHTLCSMTAGFLN